MIENDMIYLDYNATTPIDSEVAEAMKPFLGAMFGNPSSTHAFGVQARKAVDKARRQLAELLNCTPHEIIFTSGGTESNNMAIKGAALANRHKGNHIITSEIEHPAVIEVCKYLEKNGFEISYLPVNEQGEVNPEDVKKAIRPTTILITIMHANNEIGTIQPIAKIGEMARENNILFHTDAAQSVGKIPVDVQSMQVDLLSVAAHKFYGPKGIGALYIRQGVKLEKLIHGADHERNLRAGTENILEIVGIGQAAELARQDLSSYSIHTRLLRDLLHQALLQEIPDLKLNGHLTHRLPNTLNVSIPGVEANTLLSELTQVAASAGAACHSENVTVSPVIQALKVPVHLAMGTIRLSMGKGTTREEVEKAAKLITEAVARLRGQDVVEESVQKDEILKLTHFTHGLGCACKLRPQVLESVLQNLLVYPIPGILVGTESSDDATVVKLSDQLALVQTLDFFTPIVDDAYTFGAIAAANALSDIYAMGAKPLFALNIVGFPSNRLPISVLQEILQGAQDKAAEAGIAVLGGHTVDDTEPKFGMVVTGTIHPDKIWRNNTLRGGDRLILTKPIGTGILSTALKRGLIQEEEAKVYIDSMLQLNRKAAEILHSYSVSAVTDVTGFGLLGHLKEMTEGSKRNVSLYLDKIPVFSQVRTLIASGVVPGGTKDNWQFVEKKVRLHPAIDEIEQYLLSDAQTSGGLLFAVHPDETANVLNELHDAGISNAAQIGVVEEAGDGIISVYR